MNKSAKRHVRQIESRFKEPDLDKDILFGAEILIVEDLGVDRKYISDILIKRVSPSSVQQGQAAC